MAKVKKKATKKAFKKYKKNGGGGGGRSRSDGESPPIRPIGTRGTGPRGGS